jgi:hypothetical protein
LGTTIAALAEERITSQTFGMYSTQHGLIAAKVTHCNGDVLLSCFSILKTMNFEVSPGCGENGCCNIDDAQE